MEISGFNDCYPKLKYVICYAHEKAEDNYTDQLQSVFVLHAKIS